MAIIPIREHPKLHDLLSQLLGASVTGFLARAPGTGHRLEHPFHWCSWGEMLLLSPCQFPLYFLMTTVTTRIPSLSNGSWLIGRLTPNPINPNIL